MSNCFTTTYDYLNIKYGLPKEWHGYKPSDTISNKKRLLAKKEHIGFFRSFCSSVKTAKKDDIVLTRTSVGVAINRFTYWVYDEDLDRVVHTKLNKDCLIMRINNG